MDINCIDCPDPPTGFPVNTSKLNWLNDKIIDILHRHKPREEIPSDGQANAREAKDAFHSIFLSNEEIIWENNYQVFQAANYLGDIYGFIFRLT